MYPEIGIIIACVIPLFIFYKLNSKVNLIYYMYNKNRLIYFTTKSLIAILSIVLLMYVKEIFIGKLI